MTPGKIIAGVVCGAAGAWPAKIVLTSFILAVDQFITDREQLELGLAIAPFLVAGMVVILCAIAPTVLGAWFRGCIFVTVMSVIAAFQVGQCYGIGWIVDQAGGGRDIRDAALAGCMVDVAPWTVYALIAIAIAAGCAAIVVWRRVTQSGTPDF